MARRTSSWRTLSGPCRQRYVGRIPASKKPWIALSMSPSPPAHLVPRFSPCPRGQWLAAAPWPRHGPSPPTCTTSALTPLRTLLHACLAPWCRWLWAAAPLAGPPSSLGASHPPPRPLRDSCRSPLSGSPTAMAEDQSLVCWTPWARWRAVWLPPFEPPTPRPTRGVSLDAELGCFLGSHPRERRTPRQVLQRRVKASADSIGRSQRS